MLGLLPFPLQAYALSRDSGLPLSYLWCHVSSFRVPVNAVILCGAIAVALLLPLLIGDSAFFAVAGAAAASWFAAYAITISFRLLTPEEKFTPGPFLISGYIGRTGR